MSTFDRQEDRLYQDAELAQFYDLQNGWAADFDFCVKTADQAGSVLDLGCGTGELAASLAGGREVGGVDSAAAMLDVARRRYAAASRIRFTGQAVLAALLKEAGLAAEQWYGAQNVERAEIALVAVAEDLGPVQGAGHGTPLRSGVDPGCLRGRSPGMISRLWPRGSRTFAPLSGVMFVAMDLCRAPEYLAEGVATSPRRASGPA